MTTLTQELRARVRNRAQQVGTGTALLELREAVSAILEGLDPGAGRFVTKEEVDDALEAVKEQAAAEGRAQGYKEATADGHIDGYMDGYMDAQKVAGWAAPSSGWGL